MFILGITAIATMSILVYGVYEWNARRELQRWCNQWNDAHNAFTVDDITEALNEEGE